MSYIHLPRLTFSGDFISDVSTVNNDPQHYNNASFESSFQQPGQGASNGWWNPEGGATFGFQNCTVMQVVDEAGDVNTDSTLDNIIGQIVTGAEGRNSGKMVDLDPQQQMVSQLWGLTFRILTAQNELLLEGKIKATGFRDLQMRQQAGGNVNGQPLGGTWTSVIEDVVWGEKASHSPFLLALKEKTHQNKISINLNGFGYYYAHASDGRFSLGRILGSVGPWFSNEPELFAPARRLYGILQQGSNSNIFFGASNFIFDKQNARLSIDLGSSFPVSNSIGNVALKIDLFIGVIKKPINNSANTTPLLINETDILLIGKVDFNNGTEWINNCSGIVDFNNLSDDFVSALTSNQLLLLGSTTVANQYSVLAREAINGLVLRADNFVERLDTNQKTDIKIFAYQFGNPLPNTGISISMEPETPISPKNQNQPPICDIPGNNYPANGLTFTETCNTDKNGLAILSIKGNSIQNPRKYLDGQIYLLDYNLINVTPDTADGSAMPDNIISIHLRDDFKIPDKPVWSDIADIMIQFANLYPIMSKYFINFSDPNALIAKKDLLKFAFNRDINDPIYMPATRDLSESKRLTILKWLDNPIIDTLKVVSPDKNIEDTNIAFESSSPANATLTDNQQRIKNAVRAKSGAGIVIPEINNLFEF